MVQIQIQLQDDMSKQLKDYAHKNNLRGKRKAITNILEKYFSKVRKK